MPTAKQESHESRRIWPIKWTKEMEECRQPRRKQELQEKNERN